MSATLLNENQRRRVATFLQLLAEDIAHLKRQQSLPESVQVKLDAVDGCVRDISRELALPPARKLGPLHRVLLIAEVWAMRAYDLRAARLRGYGSVHPELPPRLDPLVDEMQACLRDLAAAAAAPGSE